MDFLEEMMSCQDESTHNSNLLRHGLDDFDLTGDNEGFSDGDELKDLEKTPLSNADSSLNSPMLSEGLDNLVKYVAGRSYEKIFERRSWVNVKSFFEDKRLEIPNFSGEKFHKWFGNLLLSNWNSRCHFSEGIISKWRKVSKKCYEIPKAFIKRWLKKSLDYKDKTVMTIEQIDYFKKFLFFHYLCLNQNNEKDKCLNLFRKMFKLEKKTEDPITIHHTELGDITLLDDYIYFHDPKIFLDRNCLLMVKDVLVARFQTLFIMSNRVDQKYSSNDQHTQLKLYRLVDQIMRKHGNLVYEVVGMIEPTCHQANINIADSNEPSFLKFQEFMDFLNKEYDELSKYGSEVFQLRDLILENKSLHSLLCVFGSFRHWGHPFIQVKEGLKKIHTLVTKEIEIDEEFSKKLGGDLKKKILLHQFKEKKKWFVDINNLPNNCSLREAFKENRMITNAEMAEFGDNWNDIPCTKCFDIPEVIEPSEIYADKSHSMDFSEVLTHIKNNPTKPIPTKKVLKTMLEKPMSNAKQFLTRIDREGLSIEDLIIGLKEKEREIKIAGRFFALMSWSLREYFVMTEFLIKKHYLPYFDSITMADDLTDIIKKFSSTCGIQGLDKDRYMSISNHIDYQKWNNCQRKLTNKYVFMAMDQFLGFTKVISRTHEFFENSLVYYPSRPDLMQIVDEKVMPKSSEFMVCWNGQLGGLEGLRQKGWTITNLLAIERVTKDVNTRVKVLAQGDNQVINTQYRLIQTRDKHEEYENKRRIMENNNSIMDAIKEATSKLGLEIKPSESMVSTNYSVYGKVIMIQGQYFSLESKRWSRFTCISNDQIPSQKNIMSSCSTCALTVSQFENTILEQINLYNSLGILCGILINNQNPLTKEEQIIPTDKSVNYYFGLLYLDPSLGGMNGMSLTRFMMRGFPDPITEGLTFWKMVYEGSDDPELKAFSILMGYPKMLPLTRLSFSRLLEDPLSLNIDRVPDASNILKKVVRNNLISHRKEIKNEIIKYSLDYLEENEEALNRYLQTINPLFPRFLSEFKNATFCGLANSNINLIQSSKTIRTLFARNIDKDLVKFYVYIESHNHLKLINRCSSSRHLLSTVLMWKCSAGHADYLRKLSWGKRVLGATVPHPSEMFNRYNVGDFCEICSMGDKRYLQAKVTRPWDINNLKLGPHIPYLGSTTLESTTLIHPWEKTSDLPILQRALKLRDSINWFIDPDSNISQTILSILKSLTGVDWTQDNMSHNRTGSALHRFSCSRQSSGGYISHNPILATYISITTDTLGEIRQENYDFMYQASMLFAQITVCEVNSDLSSPMNYHFHIDCEDCLRKIEDDVKLSTDYEWQLTNMSHITEKWKPESVPWFQDVPVPKLTKLTVAQIGNAEKILHIGILHGFLYAFHHFCKKSHFKLSDLFPIVIFSKLIPADYLSGILYGLYRYASLEICFRRSYSIQRYQRHSLNGIVSDLIYKLSREESFMAMLKQENFFTFMTNFNHKMISSYPISISELSDLFQNTVKCLISNFDLMCLHKLDDVVFPDVNISEIIGLFGLSRLSLGNFLSPGGDRVNQENIKVINHIGTLILDDKGEFIMPSLVQDMKMSDSDFRFFLKLQPSFVSRKGLRNFTELFTPELIGDGIIVNVVKTVEKTLKREKFTLPKRQNPTISGIRLGRLATGQHYNFRTIVKVLKLVYEGVISCADGSGGNLSTLLRLNKKAYGIFNSLPDEHLINNRGLHLHPPSALVEIDPEGKRCLNLHSIWEEPSDLRSIKTTEFLLKTIKHYDSSRPEKFNLLIIDAEKTSVLEDNTIYSNFDITILHYWMTSGRQNGTIIIKSYIEKLFDPTYNVLDKVARRFNIVYLAQSSLIGSNSSQVYIIGQNIKFNPVDLSINYNKLLENSKTFVCFKTEEEEFKRALTVKNLDTLIGIPERFIEKETHELTRLLNKIPLKGSDILMMELMYKELQNNPTTFIYLMIVFISNKVIPTYQYSDHVINPPTINDIEMISCWIIAFSLYSSLKIEDFQVYRESLWMVQNRVNIFWSRHSNKKSHNVVWNYSSIPTISVYLDHKVGFISEIMRFMHKIHQKYPFGLNEDLLNEKLTKLNMKKFDYYKDKTGVLDILNKKINKSVYLKIAHVLPGDLEYEGGYRCD